MRRKPIERFVTRFREHGLRRLRKASGLSEDTSQVHVDPIGEALKGLLEVIRRMGGQKEFARKLSEGLMDPAVLPDTKAIAYMALAVYIELVQFAADERRKMLLGRLTREQLERLMEKKIRQTAGEHGGPATLKPTA